jgi:hypothetical protein
VSRETYSKVEEFLSLIFASAKLWVLVHFDKIFPSDVDRMARKKRRFFDTFSLLI